MGLRMRGFTPKVMNSILMQYRSISKPRPLWNETALYGGYEYIALSEDVWISREYEYLLQYALAGDNQSIRKEALQELRDNIPKFKPSQLQKSDFTKLCILLGKQTDICIDKFSYSFEELSYRFLGVKFYTNGEYASPKFIQISSEELCKRTSTTLTLINELSYSLKGNIRNWANVIPYNAHFFEDNLSTNYSLKGGDVCIE